MPKKEPQLNNPEPQARLGSSWPKPGRSQALEMARLALRRANEMDLTPQQKDEVMAMIDEAKSLEKSNPLQAFKIYNELKKKLEYIKLEAEGEMNDNPEMTKRQLAILDNEIINVSNMLKTPLASVYYENELKALKLQRNTIIQSRKMKTGILPDEEVEINATEILREKEVWNFINQVQEWPNEFLFLIKKVVDEEGNLLYLNLGVLINPETEYIYTSKGTFGRYSSSSIISIEKTDVNIESGEVEMAENIAVYDEKIKKWIINSKD